MPIKSLFPSVSKRPLMQDSVDGHPFGVQNLLQLNFPPINFVLVGAILQGLAMYFFSSGRYILFMCVIALFARGMKVVLQTFNILPNPYLQGVIPGRTTALLPDDGTGELNTGNKKLVVLHLGAKSNHPLGYFAPQFVGVGDWTNKMNSEFDAGQHKGFLGQTTFQRQDIRGAPEINLISYWESIEDLWAFAHSGTHRKAWQWWEKTIKDNGYVGINHEIFEADAKHWENIYVNFQPTLMGATTYLKKGKDDLVGGNVPDEYIRPLVDARRGPLAKSSGRLGREVSAYDADRVAKETYE